MRCGSRAATCISPGITRSTSRCSSRPGRPASRRRYTGFRRSTTAADGRPPELAAAWVTPGPGGRPRLAANWWLRTGRTRMTDHDADWIPGLVGRLRVEPGSRVRLPADFDPGATLGVRKKDDGLSLLRRGMALLAEYQQRLAAQETYGVLVVLQALDAAGKDSTIRHVMSGVNPQGVKVSSFKAPSAEELRHDYLWRQARQLPARGEIGVFNRSHYEEVLVVRVHRELLEA